MRCGYQNCYRQICNDYDERFGGFLVPFLTGAVVSAPFWFLGGQEKNKPVYYPQYYPYMPNNPYAPNAPYPQYYPYTQYNRE